MIDATKVVSEIEGMRLEGHLSDALLRYAVRALSSVDRYDWVGVYLLRANDTELWLHNYMGENTEHAVIPVGEGVCGTAIATRKNQLVSDVTQVENYLSCSPDVRSEMVVLIAVDDVILGQIDIDSKKAEAFGPGDEAAVQMIADALARQLAHERRRARA